MKASSRIVVNTIAQYGKAIINTLLALYSTRVVLAALGENDYGIYSLVAGVVTMLGFLTTALSQTTQRFLSYSQGSETNEKIKIVYNNCLVLHILIGAIITILLLSIKPFLFNGFLNIPVERIGAAKVVYVYMALSLFIAFVASPYSALLTAHENIVYTSIIGVLDGLFKLVAAIILTYLPYDRLVVYALGLLLIQVFNYLAYAIYANQYYEECVIFPVLRVFSGSFVKDILSFAGWVIYGIGCIFGRSQGISVILNRFMGTAINAAYGISFQVLNAINFVSGSLSNAIRPQSMRAAGANDNQKVLKFAFLECKFSFCMLAALAIPCMFELPKLLTLWLRTVPDNTVLFCIMTLTAALCDSWTMGLGTAFQGIGKMKKYSLITQTIKFSTIIPVFICLCFNYGVGIVAFLYVLFEFSCSMLRIVIANSELQLNGWLFFKSVVLKTIPATIVNIIVCFLLVHVHDFTLRFLLTFLVSGLIYILLVYTTVLNGEERVIILSAFNKLLRVKER